MTRYSLNIPKKSEKEREGGEEGRGGGIREGKRKKIEEKNQIFLNEEKLNSKYHITNTIIIHK